MICSFPTPRSLRLLRTDGHIAAKTAVTTTLSAASGAVADTRDRSVDRLEPDDTHSTQDRARIEAAHEHVAEPYSYRYKGATNLLL